MAEIDELDTSWIQTEEKIDSIENTYLREPCDSIDVFFIYLDLDNSIEKIVSEKEVPDKGEISKERLLKIIQTRRNMDNKKYRLFDLLSFQVDIEPTHIDSFNKKRDIMEISDHCFKVLPIFDSVSCISSIFIFQDINSLYFIFKEAEPTGSLRSILRNCQKKNSGVTKKVRISDAIVEAISSISKSKTRSIRSGGIKKGTRRKRVMDKLIIDEEKENK
jgi:hypothetical protein